MNKEKIILVAITAVAVLGLIWVGSLFSQGTVVREIVEKIGAVSNPRDLGPEIGQNGLQTIVVSGDFKNSTTTLVSVQNPFPATSTVTFIGLFNSGVATTSYNINCGQSTRASAPEVLSDPSSLFLRTANVSTSSIFSQQLVTSSTTPTYIGPSQYLLCVAHGSASNDAIDAESNAWYNAFTNVNNTFDGTFWAEFRGLIK